MHLNYSFYFWIYSLLFTNTACCYAVLEFELCPQSLEIVQIIDDPREARLKNISFSLIYLPNEALILQTTFGACLVIQLRTLQRHAEAKPGLIYILIKLDFPFVVSLTFVLLVLAFYCLVWFFNQDTDFGLLLLFVAFRFRFLLFLVFHSFLCQLPSIARTGANE